MILYRSTPVTITGGGGGISAAVAYSDPFPCSQADEIKIRCVYTKAGIDVTIGVVDASASDSATISAAYDPIRSERQSSGTIATTHDVTATGRMVLVVPVGTCSAVRLSFLGSGAGVVGDSLTYELTGSEEG